VGECFSRSRLAVAVILARLTSIPGQHDSRRLSSDVRDGTGCTKDTVELITSSEDLPRWSDAKSRTGGRWPFARAHIQPPTVSTSTEFHPIGNQGSLLPTGHRRLTAAVIAVIGDHHAGLRGKSFGMIISTGRALLLLRRVVDLVL
jgi:hypothetical protein